MTSIGTPIRAKKFTDLGWTAGKDEKAAVVVAVDVGAETTCVSTFARGYENATSVLMPTAAHAHDPHAFRTLERGSFEVGSKAVDHWPSDRVLRGPAGSVRLPSQIGLVEFPAEHVLAGLVARAGEQHGRGAEQIIVTLPPFLTKERVEKIRAAVESRSKLRLAGRAVPYFVAGAYFYLLPALRAEPDKPAAGELAKWGLAALGEGRILLLDWAASALAYGVVDIVTQKKANELRLVHAGAWPSLGGHRLTLAIYRELKAQLAEAIVRAGPAPLRGRLEKDRAPGEVWKPDFYDEAFLELERRLKTGTGSPAELDRLRNLVFPTVWSWPEGNEPRGYAPIRKVAVAHARRLFEQAEAIKRQVLGDPARLVRESISWSVSALKSQFAGHVQPDALTFSANAFLELVRTDLARCMRRIDDDLAHLGRKTSHVALMGMQASSRLLTDALGELEKATPKPRSLVRVEVAPFADAPLELKSVANRGAAVLKRDDAEVSLGALPDVLPFSIAIADCVGNIEIFRAGPIDELSLFQRRLHVDAGTPTYEFFIYESSDGTRTGAWGAIDFTKPEQWTADDRTVRVDERFRFGKSGVELPRFRNWKEDATELGKSFDRVPPESLDGRISLRSWIPRDEPDAQQLLAFLESELVTTFRKKVFLLEREFDPPPEKHEFVYQRYYLSRNQLLIVTREWWAPAAGSSRLRRNKTLHVCIGSTEAKSILGIEWGRD